ncbi:MAG: hypothetical protein AB1403_00705 [Candidatus Riflebacteria bacterium]
MAKAETRNRSTESASEKPETKAGYRCLVKVKHNGETYEAGDEIELNDEQARPLLACRAVESIKSAPAKGE